MKKWAAIILMIGFMASACAQAAQWPEGRSAAQPYAGTPPVDLEKTIGYIILYPRLKMVARNFCDKLVLFLPREDVELSHGLLRLMKSSEDAAPEEIAAIDFSDPDSVTLRPMTEQEKESLIWGSGVCIEIRLPISLELNETGYYVTMEEGCFTAQNGALSSLAIVNPEAWTPVIEGEYGVSGLYYVPFEKATDEAPSEASRGTQPEPGDKICFDLVLGGDAAYAVIYSENDSVFFEEIEYTESQTVEGAVTKDPLNWGVVFLDENGNMLKAVTIAR